MPTVLACTPVAGEVCNLSPRAATTVELLDTPTPSTPPTGSPSQPTGGGSGTQTPPPLAATGGGPLGPLAGTALVALLIGGFALGLARRGGAHS